jgi:hypothetical protein
MRRRVWRAYPRHVTEAEYRRLDDDSGGLCLGCGDLAWSGCEPDVRSNKCGVCDQRLVYGVELALLAGALLIDAPEGSGVSADWACCSCGGGVVVGGCTVGFELGRCEGCGLRQKRKSAVGVKKREATLAARKGAVGIVKADDWLIRAIETQVERYWAFWMQTGGAGAWHVWFRRGSIVIAEDKPAGHELAWSERLPMNREKHQLSSYLYERLGRVPCLPEEI